MLQVKHKMSLNNNIHHDKPINKEAMFDKHVTIKATSVYN